MNSTALLSLIWFFFALLPAAIGQSKPIPVKASKLLEKAQQAQGKEDFAKAEHLLLQAIAQAPDHMDPWVRLGDLRSQLGRQAEALTAYEKALQIDPTYRPMVWLMAGGVAMELERYEEAAKKLRMYLSLNPRNERQKQSAEQLLRQAEFSAAAVQRPVPFQPTPLSPAINTILPEYLPSLSADGCTLIFTRVVDGQEDFFITRRDQPSTPWQTAEPLTALNTPLNEGAHCLSADGRTLVFTACNQPGGLGSCDLYIAYRRNGQWTPPRNLGTPVNTPGYETQPTLSADGRTLIFVSRRSGGIGGNDLWESMRQPNGSWSAPRNLGPVLNTPEDDQAPFLHPDGQTLYFMSKGHPGLGGFDLFLSRKNEEGAWSTPVNLGYPINTSRNEGALVVSADGRTGYFAKDQETVSSGGIPLTDIYTFELYPEARPTPVTYARGTIRHAVTQEPIPAEVRIAALNDFLWRTYQVESNANGEYFICLPVGSDYAFTVEKEGFLFFSEHFGLREQRETSEPYLLDIFLMPVPLADAAPAPGAPVVLRNLFFATGSADFQSASLPELERLLRLLQTSPAMRIQINGHTDDVGGEEANEDLSRRRAAAVYQYLIDQGISPERLRYEGYGESRPVVPNTSPANRARNRRTEFVVW